MLQLLHGRQMVAIKLRVGGRNVAREAVLFRQERELAGWRKFKVLKPVTGGSPSQAIADTRWAPAWEMVGGKKDAEAPLVARAYRRPDLKKGFAETRAHVSLRSSHHQVLASNALSKWSIWNLDIKNTFFQVGGFQREVCLRAPGDWDPSGTHLIQELRSPACGLNDAPAASRKNSRLSVLRAEESPALVDLKSSVPTIDRCLCVVFAVVGAQLALLP